MQQTKTSRGANKLLGDASWPGLPLYMDLFTRCCSSFTCSFGSSSSITHTSIGTTCYNNSPISAINTLKRQQHTLTTHRHTHPPLVVFAHTQRHRSLLHRSHTTRHKYKYNTTASYIPDYTMATFTEINNFDWSNMVDDRRAEYQPEQDNNVWIDKFMNEEPVMNAVAAASSTSTTGTGSPLEFSSLFDRDAQSESLFSSNVTSLDNSPLIKAEETYTTIPSMNINDQKLTRHTSTTSMASMTSESSEEASPSAQSATKKPKKKRAPRKRLTPHQKQAHNKIEKRYRININAKIAGLQQIIPWVASEKTAFETGDGLKPDGEADVPRLNKSMILEKAMSYILHLQEEEKSMNEKLEKMKREVERLGGDASAF